MGRTVDHGDDHVVDMVIEVESRGVDVDALARQLVVPGIEVLRTSGRGMIWVTALVNAADGEDAVRQVEDEVLGQLAGARVVVASVVTSAPLDDLYAELDPHLGDRDLDRLSLFHLVEATLWNRPGHASRRAAGTLGSTA